MPHSEHTTLAKGCDNIMINSCIDTDIVTNYYAKDECSECGICADPQIATTSSPIGFPASSSQQIILVLNDSNLLSPPYYVSPLNRYSMFVSLEVSKH